MHKVLGHKIIGPCIAAAIDAFFAEHPHAMETLLSAMGDKHVDNEAMDDMLAPLRATMSSLVSGGTSVGINLVHSGDYKTAIRGHLLHSWL